MDLLIEWVKMNIKTYILWGIIFFIGVIVLTLGCEKEFYKIFEFSINTFVLLISLTTIKVLLKGLFRKD